MVIFADIQGHKLLDHIILNSCVRVCGSRPLRRSFTIDCKLTVAYGLLLLLDKALDGLSICQDGMSKTATHGLVYMERGEGLELELEQLSCQLSIGGLSCPMLSLD